MNLTSSLWIATIVVGSAARSASARAPGEGGAVVTLESLLAEMIDRDSLTRWPDPEYRCLQASSYDRDTVAPDKPGWFANADRSQFIRSEERDGRTEHVMMDAAGPGAIVRFWGTFDGAGGKPFSNGTLRIYLDGPDEAGGEAPLFEGPIIEMLSGGMIAPEPLSEHVSKTCPPGNRAHNLYFPIPYAKHCKVTYSTDAPMDRGAQSGEAVYYQINYRTYAAGTEVETLSRGVMARAEGALSRATSTLVLPFVDGESANERVIAGRLASGDSNDTQLVGPAAIARVRLRVSAEDQEQALRSIVISATFDDEQTVWCPLAEFFGGGYRAVDVRTFSTNVGTDGWYESRFVMPFCRGAVFSVINFGSQVTKLEGTLLTDAYSPDDHTMHFHARWHELRSHATRGEGGDREHQDVNFVSILGKGVYVGDSLSVFNGAAAWWGEGDEKIWVDGEAFPSHVGTGTEDYYGYAWCRPEPFSSPFHAQPIGQGNLSTGYSVNTRFRGLDAIPFAKSLRFDMELWHWAETRVNYAPTVFFYAMPGAVANVRPDPEAAALPVAKKKKDVVPIEYVDDAIEAEALQVVEVTGGSTEVQDIPQFNWSGDEQLWWRDAKDGDRLVLKFAASPSRHRVFACLTKANDYAIVRLAVNGEAVGDFDRYHPSVTHDEIDLGVFDLVSDNRFELTIAGINPQAVKRRMVGIDYLRLKKEE